MKNRVFKSAFAFLGDSLSFTLLLLSFAALFSCKKENEMSPLIEEEDEEEELFFSDKLPNINSVIIKEDNAMLADGLSAGTLFLTLIDENMKVIHYNVTNFNGLAHLYHPAPNVEVIMKRGSYTDSHTGTYFSFDNGKTFQQDYTFKPERNDFWIGYIPISEKSYLLHAGSNWQESKIVRIENAAVASGFNVVLKGYNILQGFFDNGKLHVIANEVTNSMPSDSDKLYYFSSSDLGQTWSEKYFFGALGRDYSGRRPDKIQFKKVDDNTIVFHKPFLHFDFKSYDNGKSWEKRAYPVNLTDVTYFNRNEGFAVLDSSLYETRDAGLSWQLKSKLSHKADYINFKNKTVGVIYSAGFIGFTKNGGANWKYIEGR
jgi:hypothetical protein